MTHRLLRAALPAALLLGCNAPLADDPAASGAGLPPSAVPTSDPDPEGLGAAAFDPARAEEVLDATWYGDTLVSNDALVLDDVPGFLSASRSGAAVTLDFATAKDAAFVRVGTVLVSGQGGGLLRRVESLSVESGRVLAQTSEAVLTDVLFVARHWERVPLTLDPGDLPEGLARDPSTYDFSGTELFSAGSGANQARLVVDTGTVTLDPGFDWGLDVDWFDWNRPWPKLNKADLGVTLAADLEVLLHATAVGAFERSGTRDLVTFDKPFSFKVGPVPVAGSVTFDVDLVWEVSATGAADGTIGASIDADLGLGGRYLDGDWENTSGFTWDAQRLGPTLALSGDLHARAALKITAHVSMYGAVTADLAADPWVQGDATLSCGAADWSIGVGVRLDSTVGYDILSFAGQHTFPPVTYLRDPLAAGTLPLYDAASLDAGCAPGETPVVTEETVTETPGDATGGSEVPFQPEEDREMAMFSEHCLDGVDNDDDAAVDCDDSECANRMACGSECAVWDNVQCGQIVRGDTTGIVADRPSRISGYPINVGLYDGPEVGFAFRAPFTGAVSFELVDPDPTLVNQDVMVLHTPTGTCDSSDAVSWGFNEALAEVTRGEQYIVVVDGFDGDAGAFALRVNCAP